VTYTVQTQGENGKTVSVTRRFSDFEWFHANLSAEFFDVLIPPIPEKQIINRLASSFVEYRRQELERFLTRVLLHPKLSQSQFRKIFCTANEAEMVQQRNVKFERKSTPIEEGESQVTAFFGWAVKKIGTATGQQEPTKEIDPNFDELKAYVDGLNEQLVILEEKAVANIAKKKELDNTLVEFALSAESLSNSESTQDPLLSQFWKKLAESLKKMSALNSQLASNETNKFADVLKDYIRLTEAGKTLLANRFELLVKLQTAQAKNAASVTALQDELKSISESTQKELGAFKEVKTDEIRKSLREIVRINMEHQQQVVHLWKQLLSDLEEHNTI